jgi:rod shape-determining protein MreC
MENFFTRYRNITVLLSLLMAQVIMLATQIRRPEAATGESISLLRSWVVGAFVPAEKAFASVGSGTRNFWRNYIDLRGVRAQNENLQAQLDRLRLEEVSLAEDAGQARRLQSLLAFKEKFISQTVAAQVIGTSGSEHSHVLYIDKGSRDGIKVDMAVITPRGIVGKITKVFPDNTSQVLEINDATAGAGVMLERSRLRGVLHGTASGIPEILHIMADEKIEVGEPVVASGGDQIYPRGLPVGTVLSIGPDPEGGPFMLVRVKPSANLDKVEEVLVITKVVDKSPEQDQGGPTLRAADILAQRLPTVVPKAPERGTDEPPPASVFIARNKSQSNGEKPKSSSGTALPKSQAVTEGSASSTGATGSSAARPKADTGAAGKPKEPAANPSQSAPTPKPETPKLNTPSTPPADNSQPQESPR